VAPPTAEQPAESSDKVIDLMAVLKRSLEQKGNRRGRAHGPRKRAGQRS
jgi:non-homologous end joining protein Ku